MAKMYVFPLLDQNWLDYGCSSTLGNGLLHHPAENCHEILCRCYSCICLPCPNRQHFTYVLMSFMHLYLLQNQWLFCSRRSALISQTLTSVHNGNPFSSSRQGCHSFNRQLADSVLGRLLKMTVGSPQLHFITKGTMVAKRQML